MNDVAAVGGDEVDAGAVIDCSHAGGCRHQSDRVNDSLTVGRCGRAKRNRAGGDAVDRDRARAGGRARRAAETVRLLATAVTSAPDELIAAATA
jgi:hypothetical protein